MNRLATVASLLLLTASAAHADQVLLSNGDRFSGTVTRLRAGTLEFKTSFGTLKLPWSEVRELSTDQPFELTLDSKARVTGRVTTRDGRLAFADPQLSGLTVPLSDVAQIRPGDAPAVRMEGRFNLGAAATTGNTDTESYHADGEFIARTVRNRFRLGAQVNYASEDGSATTNDASAAATYDHFVADNWYLNSNIGLSRDEFKDLNLRTTAGVGVGYQFRDQPGDRLAVEGGINYIHEDFEDAEDQGQPAARYALDFLRQLSLGPTLFHRHEFLFGLEDVDDILLQAETGIRFPLLERFTGTIQVNLDYDWEPAPGNENEDVTYLVTFGYEFL